MGLRIVFSALPGKIGDQKVNLGIGYAELMICGGNDTSGTYNGARQTFQVFGGSN